MGLWPGKIGLRVIYPRYTRDVGVYETKSCHCTLWQTRRHQPVVDLQKGPWCQNGPTSPSYPVSIKVFLPGPFPTDKSLRYGSHSPIYQWSYPWSPLRFFIFSPPSFCIYGIAEPSAMAHGDVIIHYVFPVCHFNLFYFSFI